jgi:hypothetical protein
LTRCCAIFNSICIVCSSMWRYIAAAKDCSKWGYFPILPVCPKYISNKSSFHQEYPGVPDGSDSSDGTLYPLTVNQARPVASVTGCVAYLPCGGYNNMPLILVIYRIVYYPVDTCCPSVRLPLLWVWNVVTHMHDQNDVCVILFAGAPLAL